MDIVVTFLKKGRFPEGMGVNKEIDLDGIVGPLTFRQIESNGFSFKKAEIRDGDGRLLEICGVESEHGIIRYQEHLSTLTNKGNVTVGIAQNMVMQHNIVDLVNRIYGINFDPLDNLTRLKINSQLDNGKQVPKDILNFYVSYFKSKENYQDLASKVGQMIVKRGFEPSQLPPLEYWKRYAAFIGDIADMAVREHDYLAIYATIYALEESIKGIGGHSNGKNSKAFGKHAKNLSRLKESLLKSLDTAVSIAEEGDFMERFSEADIKSLDELEAKIAEYEQIGKNVYARVQSTLPMKELADVAKVYLEPDFAAMIADGQKLYLFLEKYISSLKERFASLAKHFKEEGKVSEILAQQNSRLSALYTRFDRIDYFFEDADDGPDFFIKNATNGDAAQLFRAGFLSMTKLYNQTKDTLKEKSIKKIVDAALGIFRQEALENMLAVESGRGDIIGYAYYTVHRWGPNYDLYSNIRSGIMPRGSVIINPVTGLDVTDEEKSYAIRRKMIEEIERKAAKEGKYDFSVNILMQREDAYESRGIRPIIVPSKPEGRKYVYIVRLK